jgi:hypothetical protein
MLKRPFVVLAVFLATGFWGCQSVREERIAADQCTASGGISVGDKCYPRSRDTSDNWSEQTLREMQRGFEERQPGSGRFR